MAQGAKPWGVAPNGRAGITGGNPDPGRPTSESWPRFPASVAQAMTLARHDNPRRDCKTVEAVYGPHHPLEQVVTVSSDDGQSDSQISHTRSIPGSYVEVRGC